tara:strand:+ start:535 stop:1647 length:1113 start_codon:yes stop_codon:yes gene_type:complete
MGDIWPSLTGDEPSGQQIVIAASEIDEAADVIFDEPENNPPRSEPVRAQTIQEPDGLINSVSRTGTYVGSKVQQQRVELETLQSSIGTRRAQYVVVRNTARQNAQSYYATAAAITARLQVGSTPGNPILSSQWNAAQSELDRLLTDIAALNTLGNQVAADSAMAAYLLESVRATYGLQGAVDEDHRQLALIEDETNRTVVLINRLLGGLRETTDRYTNYVNSERRNLTTLALAIKNGEYLGPSLSNQTGYIPPLKSNAIPHSTELDETIDERRPIIVIRFDRQNVEFKQALYSTLSAVLERRPQSAFDLVAIAPNQGTPAEVALASNTAKGHAQTVMRALAEMGLPSDRISLASTTSSSVQTNEVRIYAR